MKESGTWDNREAKKTFLFQHFVEPASHRPGKSDNPFRVAARAAHLFFRFHFSTYLPHFAGASLHP